VSRETPPPLPLEDEREKGRREGGATCALLTPLGLCLLADVSFWAVLSFSLELPPAESFLSLSVPVAFRPVDIPEVTGAGLGATDDDAVEADGGLDPRSRFTGDLVRAVEREEAPLDDLPVVEGTRFSAEAFR